MSNDTTELDTVDEAPVKKTTGKKPIKALEGVPKAVIAQIDSAVTEITKQTKGKKKKEDEPPTHTVRETRDIGLYASAFVPGDNTPQRVLLASVLTWKPEVIAEFETIRQIGARALGDAKQKQQQQTAIRLPYAWLRSALQIKVPGLLRIDSSLGLSKLRANAKQKAFGLVDGKSGKAAAKAVTSCIREWSVESLKPFVDGDPIGLAAIDNVLELLGQADGAFEIKDERWHTLPWRPAPSGTAKPDDDNAYAGLAEEFARVLVGQTLLPGTSPLRRVLDNDPSRNAAQLVTDPVQMKEGEFSFCVTIHIETLAGYGRPLVIFDLSKRRYARGNLRSFISASTIGGHVFSENWPDRVLTFSVKREQIGKNQYDYLADEAFARIKRDIILPTDLREAQQIMDRAYAGADINAKVRLVYAHGLTKPNHPINAGVPERDWLEAFRNAIPFAEQVGLVPFQDMAPAKATTRRPKKKAAAVEKTDKAASTVIASTDADEIDILQDSRLSKLRGMCRPTTLSAALLSRGGLNAASFEARYGVALRETVDDDDEEAGTQATTLALRQLLHQQVLAQQAEALDTVLVVLHHRDVPEQQLNLIQDVIDVLWPNCLMLHRHEIPEGAHGAKELLPHSDLKIPERFAERGKAWIPLAEKLKRFAHGKRLCCLVVSPMYFDVPKKDNPAETATRRDDNVNKPAARQALAALAGASVQYLTPMKRPTEKGFVPLPEFFHRLQSALKDLLLVHNGLSRPFEKMAEKLFPADRAPKEIIGITVVRSQGGRMKKADHSFVLSAFRWRSGEAAAEFRFMHDRGGQPHITPWMDLRTGMTVLAETTPAWLCGISNQRARDWEISLRYRSFINTVLNEAAEGGSRALVMIDSTNSARLWPWLSDKGMNSVTIPMDEGDLHARTRWRDLRIVRVRQHLAPAVMFDRVTCLSNIDDPTELVDVPGTTSVTDLFRVGKPNGEQPAAFWSVIAKSLHQHKRGSSCYRPTLMTFEPPGRSKRVGRSVPARWVDPELGQWPSPNPLELVVAIKAEGDDAAQIAQFIHKLREFSLHYDSATALPVPLFFERVARDYVSHFNLERAQQDVDDEGTEQE